MRYHLLVCVLLLFNLPIHNSEISDRLAGSVFVGTHQTVSSSNGFDSFKTQSSRTMMRIGRIEGSEIFGLISEIGESWNGEQKHLVIGTSNVHPFTGRIENNKLVLTYSVNDKYPDGRTYNKTVRLFGALQNDKIHGYFLTDWRFSNGETVQLGGPLDLGTQ